ncbi:MAG: hypothetical protein EG828_16390, partial [Deltaproteobacteria bacterium]|nr:hypothetical protein [Deltaproteobacteria bacterium]
TAPAVGTTLTAGSKVAITWNSKLSEGNIFLLYSKTGPEGPYISIVDNLSPSSGSYNWTIPNAPGTNVAIKVFWSYSSDNGVAYCQDISSTYTIKGTTSILPGLIITPPIFQQIIPSAPTSLTASGDLLGKKVTLAWKDNASSESGYVIERKTSGGSYAQLTLTAANASSYVDTTAAINTQYTYRVKAKGTISDSAYSNEAVGGYSLVFFETPKFELAFPDVPQNLAATLTSADTIELSWSAVSGSISGYKIERKIGASGDWELLVSLSSSKTSLTDTGLDADTAYSYRVRSYDALFSSGPSNEVSMTTSEEGGTEPGDSGTTDDNTMVFHMGAMAY